jgi:hypothetical protein
MKPLWLIQAGVYGTEIEPLVTEVRRQGMEAELVRHEALRKGAVVGRPLVPGSRAIAYGTFPFARQIQLHHAWVPGAWCDPDKLDCSSYYAHFAPFLLNQRFEILATRDAIAQRDRLFDAFGGDQDEVFVRPTDCGKLFVGRLASRSEFCDALWPARHVSDTRLVVAPKHPIEREWRLVVAGDRVVAASQYSVAGGRDVRTGCPGNVMEFATTMLATVPWRPDPIFMLDVCASHGRLWLVELNGFSCSWLYACDFAAVVSAAHDLAMEAARSTPEAPDHDA